MTTYSITSGYDTYSSTLAPNTSYGAFPGLVIQGATTAYSFVYFPLPADLAGQTVTSATLTGQTAAAAASLTIAARLVTSSWSDAALTANRLPTVSSTHVDTVVPVTTAADQSVTLDVGTLMSAVSAGQAWYGFRLDNPSTATIGLRSFESGVATPWVLTINTSEAPDTPQSLVPNGTVVGAAKPILSCDFSDEGGLSNDMGAIQVQIDPAQNSTTPAFDSGTVATTLPLLDLTTTAYAGLGSGSTTYWRVRVQDTSGLWSGWSDWAAFTYRPLPTLTLLTPAAGVLYDPTTDVIATTSTAMGAYRVQITAGTDRTDVKFDTGRVPAGGLTTIDVPLPQTYNGSRILVDDRNYQLHIQAWDSYTTRQGTPGLPAYVESWTTFHFDKDLSVTPVATLTADQLDQTPEVTLTWTRAAAPDAWIVYRDGKVIARLNPADTIIGTSTWSYSDQYPRPWVEHTYQVAPVKVTGGVSKTGDHGPFAFCTPQALAVWVITQDGQQVALDMTSVDQLSVNTRATTYKPVNLPYDVDIVTGFEGLSGPLTGVIPSAVDDTVFVSDAKAVFDSIKAKPATSVRLIYGTFSGEVLLRNVSVTPHALSTPVVPLMAVSFVVNQVGDFDQ